MVGKGHKFFPSTQCEICGRMLSTNGLPRVSHMRKHVRNGEAREIRAYPLRFEAIAPRANAEQQQPAPTSEKSHDEKESEGNL